MLVKASTKFNIYSELSYLLDAQHWIPSTPILFTVDPVGDFVDHKLKMVGMWVGVLVAGLRTGEIGEIWIPVQPTFPSTGTRDAHRCFFSLFHIKDISFIVRPVTDCIYPRSTVAVFGQRKVSFFRAAVRGRGAFRGGKNQNIIGCTSHLAIQGRSP